jgi:protein-S-isoprenylcysteine O-methyltransferase Ste14
MIWLILSVLLWGFLHSLLASHTAKELVVRLLREPLARSYRLVYNLFAGLSFLPILGIAAVTPDRRLYLVPFPWSVLMIIGEVLALFALLAGLRQTDVWEFLGLQHLADSNTNKSPDGPVETVQGRLVTKGMYRYVRHPLYSAGIAFIWLLPLMTINVLAINVALTVYVVIGAYFEERKLRRDFGQEYVDYAAVTPMFVPFLKGYKQSQ